MKPDIVRLEALRIAMHTHGGRAYTDIVAAAAAYHQFLIGEQNATEKVNIEERVQIEH